MPFGTTLRLLRLESGLSLRDLARRLGVSGAYLSRVEHGLDAAPTPARLADLARTLGLPPRLLLDMAHRVSPLVVDYVERVPEAGALFLEIALRRLDAAQIEALRRQVIGAHPRPEDAASELTPGAGRVAPLLSPERILLRFAGSDLGDVLDVAATRMGLPQPAMVAAALQQREAEQPALLGNGVAVPSLPLLEPAARSVLVLLDRPLPEPTPDGRPVTLVLVTVGATPPRDRLLRLARLAALAERGLASRLADETRPEAVIARLAALESELE